MLRCNRRQAVCLAAVMGVALVLRVIALSTRGIWYDDAFSFFLARSGVDQIVAGTAADTMPPLYYFALHLWMGMGNDIIILRSLNVSVSLALVILVFQLGRLLFNFRTGVTAALLTAVSPFQIYHAQELRMYGLLCLSLLLYLHFFSHIYLSRDCCARHLWIGLIAAGALAIYSHNLAVFTVVAADLLLVLQQRWRFLGRLVLAQVGIVLLAAPWLVKVPGQIAKIQRAFWTPEPGPLQLVQALVVFHTDLPVPDWLIPVAVAMSTLFAMLGSSELLRRWRGDARVQLLAAFAYFPPLLMFVTSYVMRPALSAGRCWSPWFLRHCWLCRARTPTIVFHGRPSDQPSSSCVPDSFAVIWCCTTTN